MPLYPPDAINFSAGTTSNNLSAITFSNANGVSFGLDGSTITGSVAPGGGGLTNIKISAGTLSELRSDFTFNNSNGISFGLSAGVFTGTVQTNYLTTAMASNRGSDFVQATAAFAGTNASGTIASSGISVSVGNYLTTAALSNHSHGNPQLNLTNLSGTTNSNSDGFTLSLSAAAAGGGGGITFSKYNLMGGVQMQGTTSLTAGGSSVFVEPFNLPYYVSASFLRIPISVGFGSSTFASTANTTISLQQTYTHFFCIYSQGVGASSKSIQSIYSSSVSLLHNVIYSVGAASNNQSCHHRITYPIIGNSSTTFTTSYSPAASSILRVSTTHLTAFTGAQFLDIPIATLFSPGNYWIGLQYSSTTAVTGVAGFSNLTSRGSYIAVSQISSNIRQMGANTNIGSNMWQGDGHGWWTTNSNGQTTASINLAQVSTIANQPIIPFRFDREV